MTWTNVKWIYLREIRDQLRDRRTLFTIFVLPLLLYPLLGMGFLQMAQFRRESATRILLIGAKSLPEHPPLVEEVQLGEAQFDPAYCSAPENKLLSLTLSPGPSDGQGSLREFADAALHSGRYDAVVHFPADFASQLARFREKTTEQAETLNTVATVGQIPEPAIFINSASDKSRIARDRVERVLYRWRQSIVQDNLKQNNIPIAAAEPFQVVNTDVAQEPSRRAALWSKILPFVVLIWALTGAFYPAIDLCAGEKERGTLETLLCSPAQRTEIVWGKLLTIMTFSVATSMLNLLSMGLTGTFVISQLQRIGGLAGSAGIGSPPISAVAWLLIALLPLSALFSALSLAIAAFARSSKEGQYYLMPLLLITLPLMMLPMLPNSQLDLGTSIIPVAGMMLLLRNLIEAQYLESLRFAAPVAAVTVVCCWLAIRWAVDQFNNESVLFRESERWGLGLWLRHLMRDRRDTPTVTEAVLCGVLLLVIRFFTSFVIDLPDSWQRFASTTTITLIAFFAAPAAIMAVVLTRSPRKTLLLQMPPASALLMAPLLAIAIHPLGLTFAHAVKTLYPLSAEATSQANLIAHLLEQMPIYWLLIVLALVPAVCEELAFRGFILSGMRHSGHKWGAIVGSALFFGAAHGILQQSMSAAVMGVVLGYLAVQTGSLLVTILFHFLYNSLSLLTAFGTAQISPDNPVLGRILEVSSDGIQYRMPFVILSAVVTSLILMWFRSLPCESTKEETLQRALDSEWFNRAESERSGATS